jgi:hypothetical protein
LPQVVRAEIERYVRAHFGGPKDNQPFKLHPNGRVFDPEAVMNPFSLGGEKRNPFPTDVAAISSLYSRSH